MIYEFPFLSLFAESIICLVAAYAAYLTHSLYLTHCIVISLYLTPIIANIHYYLPQTWLTRHFKG